MIRPSRNRPRRVSWRAPLLALMSAALLALGSCAENPATGERYFSLMSSAQEQQVGAEEHPQLVQEFGGEYKDPELQRYVDSIGALLAKATETPNQKFTFTIIDSQIVNAFALPGGYVHVTRGLIALANNEAELASVLGHEMGHVTAHHSAQLYTRSVLTNILAAGIGLATGSNAVGSVLGQGADVYLKSYSRENEYQADSLGVRYIKRAGYDPEAMASFLKSLEASSRLEAELDGLPPDTVDKFNIMATHPRTLDRVQRAIEEAGGAHGGELDRDVYLQKINGIVFGDSPDQGYVRGDRFVHPKLGFQFQVPTGFKLANQPDAVIARNPNGGLIAFDEMPKANGVSPRAALAQMGVPLTNVEDIEINGLPAATGQGRASVNGTAADVRIVAIRFSPEHMFRFLFITPPQLTAGLADGFKRTTYSFRRLTSAEAAALKPRRIQVIRVKSGDTVASLADRMAFSDRKEERFRVLNGLQPNEALKAGMLVKIVVEHDVPKAIQ